MPHLFIHLFVYRHFNCFRSLAIINHAAINTCVYSNGFLLICVSPKLAQVRINSSATATNSELRGSQASARALGIIVKQGHLFLFLHSFMQVPLSCFLLVPVPEKSEGVLSLSRNALQAAVWVSDPFVSYSYKDTCDCIQGLPG